MAKTKAQLLEQIEELEQQIGNLKQQSQVPPSVATIAISYDNVGRLVVVTASRLNTVEWLGAAKAALANVLGQVDNALLVEVQREAAQRVSQQLQELQAEARVESEK